MNKAFSNFTWYNKPDTRSPLMASLLNRINTALDTVDDRVVSFDTTKANQSDLQQSLKNVTYNATTGVWIFTYWNGTVSTYDQNIEKIPVSFRMTAEGVIIMTTADGTEYTADISKKVKPYTFADSSIIDFTTSYMYDAENPEHVLFDDTVSSTTINLNQTSFDPGILSIMPKDESDTLIITSVVITYDTDTQTGLEAVIYPNETYYRTSLVGSNTFALATQITGVRVTFNGTGADYTVKTYKVTGIKVTATVKDGSITDSKLQPNYLADITQQANLASQSATSASNSANDADYDARLAKSYAIGDEEIRPGSSTDCARYYKEQAAAIVGATGHVIIDGRGNTMPSRTSMQFLNGVGTDDSTDDITKIAWVITDSEWAQIQSILA